MTNVLQIAVRAPRPGERAALERADTYRQNGEALDEQLVDQRTQTESLRSALRKLEHKLTETHTKVDYLIGQHRRSRAVRKVAEAGVAVRHHLKRAWPCAIISARRRGRR